METIYLARTVKANGYCLLHQVEGAFFDSTSEQLSMEYMAGFLDGVSCSGLRQDVVIRRDSPNDVLEVLAEGAREAVRPLTHNEFRSLLSEAGLKYRQGKAWCSLNLQ